MPKRGRPKDAKLASRRREEILDIAAHVFAKNGYRQADVQEIADALKLGKGTIYRYFETKETLFLKTVDRAMQRLRHAMDKVMADTEDPLAALQALVRTYLTFFDQNPDLVELFIQERAEFKDRKKPTYFEYRDADQSRWLAMAETLIAQGRVRNIPPRRIMDTVSELLYGAIFTNYFSARSKSLLSQADDITDIVLHGILAERERGGQIDERRCTL